MKRIWFELRCLWCEIVFGWAMWICPEKYCPSYIEMVIEASTDLTEKGWRVSRVAPSEQESAA